MDPALQEQLLDYLDPDEVLEAIIRLRTPGEMPGKIRVVSVFKDIITCRVRRGDILEVYDSPFKASFKAARMVVEDKALPEEGEEPGGQEFYKRRPGGPTGAGVVVGVIDWGLDFTHPDFLDAEGHTRLLGLWDQSEVQQGPPLAPYGYGKLYTRAAIDEALRHPAPFERLGYYPAKSDATGIGAHGTHVASIACGNRYGIAPGADLVFVHLAARDTGGTANMGDSVRILEALDFIRRMAGNRPLVVNGSLGSQGAPKDGTTVVERGIDNFLSGRPATMMCQSTGNYYATRGHSAGVVRPGRESSFSFEVGYDDRTPNELEVWYSGRDVFQLRLKHLPSSRIFVLGLGEKEPVLLQGELVGRVYHRKNDPNNGKNHINLFLYRNAPPGVWHVTLYGEKIIDGGYHAYIERDNCSGCQARFLPVDVERRSTIGSLASTHNSLVVGAYDPHAPAFTLAPFSSAGPTVDGRIKPDLVAPGVRVRGARSSGRNAWRSEGRSVRMSGTSMAAPHVTGTCALLLELLPPDTPFWKIRNLVLGATEPALLPGEAERLGSGILNIDGAIWATLEWRRQHVPHFFSNDQFESMKPNHIHIQEEVLPGAEALTSKGRFSLNGGRSWHTVRIDTAAPLHQGNSFDQALQFALRQRDVHTVITGNILTGNVFRVFRYRNPVCFIRLHVMEAQLDSEVACLVLNGAFPYFPDNLLRAGTRWVWVPRLREFYSLAQQDRTRQRNTWIGQLFRARQHINVPGQTVDRAWLGGLSAPALRLLVAYHQAHTYNVGRVNRSGRDRGGVVNGKTLPPFAIPLREPDCYLAVIAFREGKMESVNAWDYQAGISVGPIQINANRGAVLRFLHLLWREDRPLFNQAFGHPYQWTMRWNGDHPVLEVNAGQANAFELSGLDTSAADYTREWRRTFAYFQSGNPNRHQLGQIDPDFRRRLARSFLQVLVWPHVQEMVLEVSAWWLKPGLQLIHANGIAALNTSRPDRATFVLKALLLSTFVRYSGCLRPLLNRLSAYSTVAAKLTHWETALNQLSALCRRLRDRLRAQQNDAGRIFAAIQRLRQAGTPSAVTAPSSPAPAEVPIPSEDIVGTDQEQTAEKLPEILNDEGFPGDEVDSEVYPEDEMGEETELTAENGESEGDAVVESQQIVTESITVPMREEEMLRKTAELFNRLTTAAEAAPAAGLEILHHPGDRVSLEALNHGQLLTRAFGEGKLAFQHPAKERIAAGELLGPDQLIIRSTEIVAPAETLYLPTTGRSMVKHAFAFRTAPDPPLTDDAYEFPTHSSNPDDESRQALRQLGLNNGQINRFERNNGLVGLRPIAARFGSALPELLRRLRYPVRWILRPPHFYNNLAHLRRQNGGINLRHQEELLAPRVLLAIPDHFRELARKSHNAVEAFAMENLGWLVMYGLRDALQQQTGSEWWLPPKPLFVSAFPAVSSLQMPLTGQLTQLIADMNLSNSSVSVAAFLNLQRNWEATLPGRLWEAETGRSSEPAGYPFYASLVTVPARVNITAQRSRIDAVWQQRLQQTDAAHPYPPGATAGQRQQVEDRRRRDLVQCQNNAVSQTGLIGNVSLQGIHLAYRYPCLTSNVRHVRTQTAMLSAIHPVVTGLFSSLYELGWNDLIYQTGGSGCFRGIKKPASVGHTRRYNASRRLSEHGYGQAIDLNAHENEHQSSGAVECMSPRVVALFETYGFTWGKSFRVNDMHHFEYR